MASPPTPSLHTNSHPTARSSSPPSPPFDALPQLEILEWNAVGVWTALEDCTVCRVDLEDQCRYCLTERDRYPDTTSSGALQQSSDETVDGRLRGPHTHSTRGHRTRVGGGGRRHSSGNQHTLLVEDGGILPAELYAAARPFVCPVVRGACHHVFHVHCLQAWYKKSKICPLCGVEWRSVSILPTNVKVHELGPVLSAVVESQGAV